VSQYAKANNLAHGLGGVKDKPEVDFKEMDVSLDFLVLFYQEKSTINNLVQKGHHALQTSIRIVCVSMPCRAIRIVVHPSTTLRVLD
jgi:hypothetical protein